MTMLTLLGLLRKSLSHIFTFLYLAAGVVVEAQTKSVPDTSIAPIANPAVRIPLIPLTGQGKRIDGSTATMPVSSVHSEVDLELFQKEITGDTGFVGDAVFTDSAHQAVRSRARDWVGRLFASGDTIRGMYLDHFVSVATTAKEMERARQALEARLAEPGISDADRAYTLLRAIRSFADIDDSSRMTLVERYVDQLDGLGVEAASHQYMSRVFMVHVYAESADASNIIRHSSAAIQIAKKTHFEDRWRLLIRYPYQQVADVLAGLPNARKKIDSLGATLIAALAATPQEIKEDSIRKNTAWAERILNKEIARYRLIGRPATPIQAHVWYNRGAVILTQTPQSTSLADGKIRVLEFGDRNCVFCLMALPHMQWLSEQFPHDSVEINYVTATNGNWGVHLVSEDVEVEAMRHFYTNPDSGTVALTFPIAVWAGPKQSTDEGGMLPAESPNLEAYSVSGTPTLVIVDGRGIVRMVSVGWSAGKQFELMKSVRYLLNEHAAKQTGNSTRQRPVLDDDDAQQTGPGHSVKVQTR